ncbi:hypothetical protein, partial [uncultured Nevskia sp.]|uniref:hypothetical protein n=1 Tax=uncultured Nevskia sp. TaxID=228950 RepID=UPI0025E41395
EIRTMRKDLQVLRENDALKERYKIVHIKTLEEQLEEKRMADLAVPIKTAQDEKIAREEILQKNEGQERLAEKDLKSYATEQERQHQQNGNDEARLRHGRHCASRAAHKKPSRRH